MTKKYIKTTEKVAAPARAPSHRQLRVGEEMRHILAEVLMRGDFPDLELAQYSVTVTQVQVSPDLHNASVFIMPLGGDDKDNVLVLLRKNAPYVRHVLSKKLKIRHVPVLTFLLDHSFDHAEKMDDLIRRALDADMDKKR